MQNVQRNTLRAAILTGGIVALLVTHASAAQPLLLQAGQGEQRTRLPRPGVNVTKLPTFLIKIDAQNGGSQSLVMLTEDLRPGAVIPWHRHLRQEEIVLTESGTVRAQVGDRTARLGPNATIFIPRNTWVTIANIGTETVRLVAIFDRPGFERFLRCVSVPAGQPVHAMTQAQVDACYRLGEAQHR